MLVAEDRDALVALLENVEDLLEQLVARVKLLVFVVEWVVAVLPDEQDGAHGEFVAVERQGAGDVGVQREAVFLG